MAKSNKAHTATANRIARRYDGTVGQDGEPDVRAKGLTVEVETQATLQRGLRRLKTYQGAVYLAVTNKEAVAEAVRLTRDSEIGVMDPQGNIIKQFGAAEEAS